MTREIQVFFERYRDAFNRLDGKAVADFFAVPSGITTGDRYTHWPTRDAVEANMVALCERYRAHGYREAAFEPRAFLPQGPNHSIADLAWHIERSAGEPSWDFRTTYNLLKTPEGWRVLLCTAYEEQLPPATTNANGAHDART